MKKKLLFLLGAVSVLGAYYYQERRKKVRRAIRVPAAVDGHDTALGAGETRRQSGQRIA